MKRTHAAAAVLAATLLLAGVGATAPAAAIPPTAALPTAVVPGADAANPVDPTTQKRPVHCAVEVRPIDQPPVESVPVCFADSHGVDRYLDAVTSADASSRGVAAASTPLGTVYSNSNGGGSSLTFWGASGCYGVVFGFSSMPSGWSSNVSSAGGSNGCWVTLYGATGYGGARLNCTPWCGGVGSLNDQVRSVVFRPTGTFG
ncbi:hypothetical protein [Agromyces subbeticus]|uniref:hypothetical protein n=1 Tax=Agromyces subbeticus TaxID=293890 RepID=UPI0003B7B583|nr:hypothetical protein [Agromyces subbeticus]